MRGEPESDDAKTRIRPQLHLVTTQIMSDFPRKRICCIRFRASGFKALFRAMFKLEAAILMSKGPLLK